VFYVSAWLAEGKDAAAFERSVPLLFGARRLRRMGSRQEVVVLFLDGFDRLSTGYVDELAGLGFHALDASGDLRRAESATPALGRFNRYEHFCFLRWLVLDRVADDGDTVIHLDGDLVFGAAPERVAEALAGRTLVLQGCPALTAITDRDWFAVYAEELARFCRDIDGYSAAAWSERAGWEESHRLRWAGSRYRDVIGSDQDLISHLIHTERLPQSDPRDLVAAGDLYWAENPLYIQSHAQLQLGRASGISFTTVDGRCYLDSREVAVWHLQSDFVRYLARSLALSRMHWPGRIPNDLESPRLAKVLPPLPLRSWHAGRLAVCESVRELNGGAGGLSFGDVFSARRFWQAGVFADDPSR
jgi:hypothetical protein